MKHQQKPGRPSYSIIRENIKKLLSQEGPQYGYMLFKQYQKQFGRVALRSIYYHLHKGLEKREFVIVKAEKTKGSFSWGRVSERTVYGLKEEKR